MEKSKRLVAEARVPVDVFQADINELRLDEGYDDLFSTDVLHHVPPSLRGEFSAKWFAEETIDCMPGYVPHRHCVDRLIARNGSSQRWQARLPPCVASARQRASALSLK